MLKYTGNDKLVNAQLVARREGRLQNPNINQQLIRYFKVSEYQYNQNHFTPHIYQHNQPQMQQSEQNKGLISSKLVTKVRVGTARLNRSSSNKKQIPKYFSKTVRDEPPELITIQDDLTNQNAKDDFRLAENSLLSLEQSRLVARCTEELAVSRRKQEQLQKRIREYQLSNLKEKEYQTLIDSLVERNHELEMSLSRLNQTVIELDYVVKKHDTEIKVQRQNTYSLKAETEKLRSQNQYQVISKEICAYIEKAVKKEIAEFVKSIKVERMSKSLEDKIEGFLETVLLVTSRVNEDGSGSILHQSSSKKLENMGRESETQIGGGKQSRKSPAMQSRKRFTVAQENVSSEIESECAAEPIHEYLRTGRSPLRRKIFH